MAFWSVLELGKAIGFGKVKSVDLTRMYLSRLKHRSKLHFVITLTEERAIAQAKKADEEIMTGKYRGPLHGIPWGAKDLLAVKGYPTTWGAGGFEHQTSTKTRPWFSVSMPPARCWWRSCRWACWPWAINGSAGARATRGIRRWGRADRRRAQHFPGRFIQLHVKDLKAGFPPSTVGEDRPEAFTEVGQGVIDWRRIFESALKGGVQHYYVEQDHSSRDTLESARMSYEYLHNLEV